MSEITKAEFEETQRKVREAFHQIEVDTLQKMPLWMRLNYFCNKIGKAINDSHTDDEINWSYVNELCIIGLSEFDYNMYQQVTTFEEFNEQRLDVICATENLTPWHKHKCKDCGNDFYMMHSEVMFYQDKQLNLPKRCKECRAKRKGGN